MSLPVSVSAIRHLERIYPGHVVCGVPLARISRWRNGGLADVFFFPRSGNDLARVSQFCGLAAEGATTIGDAWQIARGYVGLAEKLRALRASVIWTA